MHSGMKHVKNLHCLPSFEQEFVIYKVCVARGPSCTYLQDAFKCLVDIHGSGESSRQRPKDHPSAYEACHAVMVTETEMCRLGRCCTVQANPDQTT